MFLPDSQLIESLAVAFADVPLASDDAFRNATDIRSALLSNERVRGIVELVNEVLTEQGFVQIKGFSPEADRLLAGWTCLLGSPHVDKDHGGGAIRAEVRPGQHLMGNQLRELPLHTDYSMLESPPWLTISFCRQADPINGLGNLAIVDAECPWFGLESSSEFRQLSSVLFPFAGMSVSNTTEVIHRPIVSTADAGKPFLVRYHRSRIVQGFRCTNQVATEEQAELMLGFENRMNSLSRMLTIDAGDLTIVDNHRMLHGRGCCSVELTDNLTVSGRKMQFAFAHSIDINDLGSR